jgi:hypothetical protein
VTFPSPSVLVALSSAALAGALALAGPLAA